MPILKNKTPGSFVMIGKDILKNTDLKLVDRGMLATLLSLPDNWDFSIVGLAKILPEGKFIRFQSHRVLKICVRIIGILKSRMQKNGIPKTCHNIRIKHRIIMN